MNDLPRNTILAGDVIDRLAVLPASSVDCVVTSPPYFQLRDYGVRGQLGLEDHVDAWVEGQRAVCGQLSRVLKPTGSVWLNLGDAFSRHARYGAPSKGLLLSPERLLIALVGDGWIVRNKVIWAKPNPMPTSVGDRLADSYEVVYLLVRNRHYFFDLDAIREPFTAGLTKPKELGQDGGPLRGKNPGDVWTIPTSGFRGAHFATFPKALIRRPILASCPEAICTVCGTPWRRKVRLERLGMVTAASPRESMVRTFSGSWRTVREIGDLIPCGCGAPTRPGVVLDPFFGTGTVGLVARDLGRDWLGIELNPRYVELARQRLHINDETGG